MKTYKLTNHLWLHDYIPEQLYRQHCDHKPHFLMNCLDPRLVKLDEYMRARMGEFVINNWIGGGPRQWSGLRTQGSPYYSYFSQHAWGRASDKIFSHATAEEVRRDIIKNYELYKPLGLRCIEANVNWVHSDVRGLLSGDDLLIVYP